MFAAPTAKFCKTGICSVSDKAFPGLFGGFFWCWTHSKKEKLWYTRIQWLLVNWCSHSLESRALTCPFQQSHLSAWSLLSWCPARTHLWEIFASEFFASESQKVFVKIFDENSRFSSLSKMSIFRWTILHTGWRRLIGSPKSQIIFRKRAIKYRSLLRKMTYKDKGSYESSPPSIILIWTIMCILWKKNVLDGDGQHSNIQNSNESSLLFWWENRVLNLKGRRNGVETKQNEDKSSSCDVDVTCNDVRWFPWTVLDTDDWFVVVQFLFHQLSCNQGPRIQDSVFDNVFVNTSESVN